MQMNLFNWITALFKPKMKTLPEPLPKAEHIEYSKNISDKKIERKQFLGDLSKKDNTPKYNTIEHAINQYLMSLYYIYKQDHTVDS